MTAFNSVDIKLFADKVSWAKNQARGTSERKLRDEYLALASAYEHLIENIKRQGPIEEFTLVNS